MALNEFATDGSQRRRDGLESGFNGLTLCGVDFGDK
jgi:hypothetical protein